MFAFLSSINFDKTHISYRMLNMNNINLRFNVDKLLRRLSVLNNRDYEKQEIAKTMNMSRTSLYGILSNSNTRVDLPTLAKLLDFFHREGMPIGVGDLFTVTDSPDD